MTCGGQGREPFREWGKEEDEDIMIAFDKEVMWAVSGTGDDVQCVHVDFAREQQAEIERMRAFIDWLDGWVSKPIGAYSAIALDGFFVMARDKIAALEEIDDDAYQSTPV